MRLSTAQAQTKISYSLFTDGLMEPAQWLQNEVFKTINSNSSSGAGPFPFMAPTPDPFNLNFAGSGSVSTKVCYTSYLLTMLKIPHCNLF